MSFTRRIPLDERFRLHFTAGSKAKCWVWRGAPNSAGYGTIRHPGRRGRTVQAHRLSYEVHTGPIPLGMCVLHRCDNRLCVNPHHLFLGTNADNVRDRDTKGRCRAGARPGQACGHAKITDAQAAAVRLDPRPNAQIAKEYGVSRSSIARIKLRQTFRNLP